MKRSGFKSKQYKPMARTAMKRGASKLKSSGKRMKGGRSTTTPTVEEKAWMDWITAFGCVVCRLRHKVKTPAAVHHIVEGSRRLGHLFTIPLCQPGHHMDAPKESGKISRHPYKARFESAYGTEYDLLNFLKNIYEKNY